jgi:hypothetical protein
MTNAYVRRYQGPRVASDLAVSCARAQGTSRPAILAAALLLLRSSLRVRARLAALNTSHPPMTATCPVVITCSVVWSAPIPSRCFTLCHFRGWNSSPVLERQIVLGPQRCQPLAAISAAVCQVRAVVLRGWRRHWFVCLRHSCRSVSSRSYISRNPVHRQNRTVLQVIVPPRRGGTMASHQALIRC